MPSLHDVLSGVGVLLGCLVVATLLMALALILLAIAEEPLGEPPHRKHSQHRGQNRKD